MIRFVLATATITTLSVSALCGPRSPSDQPEVSVTAHTTTDGPASRAAADPPKSAALRDLDARIDATQRAAQRRDDDWMNLEILAKLYVQRGRMTGDWADYRRAEEALDQAFRRAPQGLGPHLTRATLAYSMHRISAAERDVARVEGYAVRMPETNRIARSLRADIAFHQGHYRQAESDYAANLEELRDPTALVASAQWAWKTGDFEHAEALLHEASSVAEAPTVAAWVSLVRGLYALDRGRYEDALSHYRAGLQQTPESWLLQEHAAEILLLLGHEEAARLAYVELVDRTDSPEFMDALAGIHRDRGETDAAQRWIARAREGWEARLAMFPEAAYGHALDHWLDFEDDPARAVSIARANAQARPGGEAQVKLAQAYLAAGRADAAAELMARVLDTPWRTAELHAVASETYAALGDAARAGEHRAHALAINPHAFAS